MNESLAVELEAFERSGVHCGWMVVASDRWRELYDRLQRTLYSEELFRWAKRHFLDEDAHPPSCPAEVIDSHVERAVSRCPRLVIDRLASPGYRVVRALRTRQQEVQPSTRTCLSGVHRFDVLAEVGSVGVIGRMRLHRHGPVVHGDQVELAADLRAGFGQPGARAPSPAIQVRSSHDGAHQSNNLPSPPAAGGPLISSTCTSWCVLRWATALQIDTIIVENVREFTTWGPLGSNGRPLKSRRGETFQAFLDALRSLGYKVDWRVLNAADFGDPTTRERLFIQARRGRRPIAWPSPTHSDRGGETLFGRLEQWRPAREIIDWSIPGESIFTRRRPLSPNTIARIAAGLRKFGGKAAEPFLVLLRGTSEMKINSSSRSVDKPVPTVTTSGGHVGLCEPFLVPTSWGERAGQQPRCHSIDRPMPTVVGSQTHAVVQPFILPHRMFNGQPVDSVDDPLRTVLPKHEFALVEPFIVNMEHGGANGSQVRPVEKPLLACQRSGSARAASVAGALEGSPRVPPPTAYRA